MTTTPLDRPEPGRAQKFLAPGSRSPYPARLSEDSLWRLPEWILRAIGQVDFQNNWLTGVMIIVAIFYNSWIYGVDAILGTSIATLTALGLKADRQLIKAGLFGFSGTLFAIGINAFYSRNFTAGDVPSWRMYVYIVVGSSLTAALTAALMTALGPMKVPTFTWPFNIAGWLFVFGALKFSAFHPGPFIAPSLPHSIHASGPYGAAVWYKGIGNGIAEVFFQNNWITGYIMALALFVNSRIAAIMALGGSAIGVGTAIVLRADAGAIESGLFGFNDVLTMMALGGFFFVLTYRVLIWCVVGTVITTFVWAALTVAFGPVGMPAFTGPFCIVATIAVLAKHQFSGLLAVAPANATSPEDNLRRSRAGADLS